MVTDYNLLPPQHFHLISRSLCHFSTPELKYHFDWPFKNIIQRSTSREKKTAGFAAKYKASSWHMREFYPIPEKPAKMCSVGGTASIFPSDIPQLKNWGGRVENCQSNSECMQSGAAAVRVFCPLAGSKNTISTEGDSYIGAVQHRWRNLKFLFLFMFLASFTNRVKSYFMQGAIVSLVLVKSWAPVWSRKTLDSKKHCMFYHQWLWNHTKHLMT